MLKLMYITNRPEVAEIAGRSGVDRIFVDLETIGKSERQGGMDTVQSHHQIADIAPVKAAFNGELLVRSNPIHPDSEDEINRIIDAGADIVMLPYFKTVNEAAKFIDLVDGRAKVSLLVETAEAVDRIDSILDLDGIDEIHIGLNDLHLAYGMKFMFELLSDGTVERLSRKVLAHNIRFGFGGIAKLGYGDLPAEKIIKEHYRLGSTCVILSRSFCNVEKINDLQAIRELFRVEMAKLRCYEKDVEDHLKYFTDNTLQISKSVSDIIEARKS